VQSAECNEDKDLGCRLGLIYATMEGKRAPETDLGLVPVRDINQTSFTLLSEKESESRQLIQNVTHILNEETSKTYLERAHLACGRC